MPAIPARPKEFHPEIPPPGFEDQRVKMWRDRPKIAPRLQLFHTNGASREGSIEASKSWAERGGGNTIPHCQIDRSGRGAMLLPSDRKGIANYRAADFSLGFETADTGYLDDPTISAFTDKQAESCSIAGAYYSILHGIELAYPKTWDGNGTASHTEPFGYPDWTNAKGKICPGLKKKAQVRDLIIPRARVIVASWMETPAPDPGPPPPVPVPPLEGDDMVFAAKQHNSVNWWYSVNGGADRIAVRNPAHADNLVTLGLIDAWTRQRVDTWDGVATLNDEQLADRLGPVV